MNETDDVTGIAFSADGKWAATGSSFSNPARIILWEVSNGHDLRRFVFSHPGFTPIFDVAFGPGDKIIFGSSMRALCLWDIETGAIIRRYTGHTEYIWSLAISPDGKYIFSSSDKEVILWDYATRQALHRLSVHKQSIYSMAFSYDI